MRRPATPTPVVLAIAASLVAACTGSATPAPTPSGTAAPTSAPSATAVPSGSEGPDPSAIFTIAPSGGPTSAPSTPGATATAAATAAPEPSPSGAFACAYPYERAATRTDPVALVRDVRVGAHDTYDRIVFEFLGAGVPRLRIERATPPFVKDPSGLPLTVAGSSFLHIVLMGASGAGYATANGQPSYSGATTFNAGYARLTSLVQAGDFEGITSWYAGLTGPMCYSILELGSPARLAIDLRAP